MLQLETTVPETRDSSLVYERSRGETATRLSRRRFLALSSGAALGAVFTSQSAQAADHPVKAFLGGYRHIGGKADREALDRAIEEVVSKMSLITRGIARKRIRESNPIPPALSFSADAKSLTLAMGTRGTHAAPLDGSIVKVRVLTGETMDMSFKFRADEIVQVFTGDERGSTNRFKFRDDRLVMSVRVHASQLPIDLVYQLSFERL